MGDALEGVRVLELRQGIAAAYCTMLMGDLGADVVIATDGSVAQDPDPPLSAQLYLDRNKRSILLEPATENGQRQLMSLVGWADVVVEELRPETRTRWGVDPHLWRSGRSELIYASITPFGLSGPETNTPASDLIVQAVSGFMSITGFPDDPPTRSGTSLSEYYTGVATGVAVLAALRHRDRTGRGQLLDMALLDTLLTAMEGVPDGFFRTGEIRPRTGNSNPASPGYGFYEAKDGYVATAIQGVNIWPRFCAAVDRPDLAERPQFNTQEDQDRWGAAVAELLIPWCRERTRAEIVERLVREGVPAAPVNTLTDVIHEPVLLEREMLVEVDDPRRGRITITGSPLHLSKTPGRVRRAAPTPGQDTGEVLADVQTAEHGSPVRRNEHKSGVMAGALADVRVIDLGTVIAQPYNTGLLADLGAEVIKIAEPAAAERAATGAGRRFRDPGLIPMGSYRDRNKESIALNLRHPEGVELVKELVRHGDVVIENFSPGTMDRMGVGYEALRAENPRIIYGAVSAFGQTGPYSHHRGYDILAQARTGYGSVTGFPQNPPTRSGNSITDYFAGLLCAFSVLAALRHRDKTGEGQAIDIALFEALFMQLEGFVERTKNDNAELSRLGNESLVHGSSCGVYQSQDGWLAIDAHRDEWWAALSQAIGRPELTTKTSFATYAARRDNADLVRDTLAYWVAGRSSEEGERVLRAAGVPAARVLTVAEMVEQPQVQDRGVYATVVHANAGRVTITGTPFGHLSATPGRVVAAPPLANQHVRPVLKRVLGYADKQIDYLEAEGVFHS